MRRLPLILLTLATAAFGAEKWTPELSMQVKTVDSVTPSSDGDWVAFTVSEAIMDDETSEYRTQIHVARADGSRTFQLTRGETSASNPQFSPDGGFVYFQSKRDEKPSIWRIALNGGEAERVFEWEGELGGFAVSPDGERLAFTARPKDEEREKAEKAKTDFRVVNDDDKNMALWTVALEAGAAQGEAKRATPLDEHVGRFDWSPDSKNVAFATTPSAVANDWIHSDLKELDVETGEARLAAGGPEAEDDPHYSPDGRSIAFIVNEAPARWAGACVLAVVDRERGETQHLATPLPDECGRGTNLLGWSADGQKLLFTTSDGLGNLVRSMSLEGEQETVFDPGEGVLSGYRLSSGGQVGFALESISEPSEAYVFDLNGQRPTKLSAVNGALELPPLGRAEAVRWKSSDGLEIEGLLTYPVDYEEGETYPLIVNIHGGPMGVFQRLFQGRRGLYPTAAFASEGFAVLQPNPRGSSGYGREFRFANYDDWGGGDYQDIMTGVDHVIDLGVADPDRMAVMGWSYGGFMTSWIIGHTDRFRAAAIGAPVTNLWSFTGTADIPGFLPDYFSGEAWQSFDKYVKHSPLTYADKVSTPALILHGEADLRVPISQSYELYTALRRRDVDVEMVVYPRTPHGPREPKFTLDVMRRHLTLAKERLLEAPSKISGGRLAPELKNFGDLQFAITTEKQMAQRFFNQGLTFVYAFNHGEGERSFEEAARLDPECAMCFWGQALARGPNINDSVPGEERERKAHEAIEQARALAEHATGKERALIEAMAARHPSPNPDSAARNRAYAEAMAEVYEQYPDDPDVATLYAAALMNQRPWDYWADGETLWPELKPLTETLEKVVKNHPRHPGGHHYYIHAVEASDDPDRAVSSADQLGGLVPIAGHLVHMPSHIYIRVGRYRDASDANVRASAADEDYITQCRAQGAYPITYYPHNVHFLWASLTMEGRAAEAIEASKKVATRHTDEHLAKPGFAFPHLLRSVPLFALTRFGRWDELLATPEPADSLPFSQVAWRFGRGMAFRATGDVDKAAAELAALQKIAEDPRLEELKVYGNNPLADLARIGEGILAGEIAAMRGDYDEAVQSLEEAIAIEDGLVYSEPRDWPQPARQSLGAVLLEAGRAQEAEEVYRADLKIHRNNGWSLFGLWKSLEAQGLEEDAERARAAFETAWSGSDIKLNASRF